MTVIDNDKLSKFFFFHGFDPNITIESERQREFFGSNLNVDYHEAHQSNKHHQNPIQI